MVKGIASYLAGVFVSMFGWISNLFQPAVPVETAEQALSIGVCVAHEKFPNVDYSRYKVDVVDGDVYKPLILGGRWCVSYELLDENGESALVFGGGGPEIYIRKKDGKVVRAVLQR